jgi:hypothetical protein
MNGSQHHCQRCSGNKETFLLRIGFLGDALSPEDAPSGFSLGRLRLFAGSYFSLSGFGMFLLLCPGLRRKVVVLNTIYCESIPGK